MPFLKKRKEKNPFKADLILDSDEIKVVEAEYRRKPIFFGVGTAKGKEKGIEGEVSVSTVSGRGAYESRTHYDWKLYYNPSNLPGFLPMESLTYLATNATTTVSGSIDALKAVMVPIPERGIVLEYPSARYTGILISDKGVEIEEKKPRIKKK